MPISREEFEDRYGSLRDEGIEPMNTRRRKETELIPWTVAVRRIATYRVMAPANATDDEVLAAYEEDAEELDNETMGMEVEGPEEA